MITQWYTKWMRKRKTNSLELRERAILMRWNPDSEFSTQFTTQKLNEVRKEIEQLKTNKEIMKYRIKITTFKNGRKEYRPYVKRGLFWWGIYYDGSTDLGSCQSFGNREAALYAIDSHCDGNYKKQTIEFEYITKP